MPTREDLMDEYEERAAIMQYDGGLTREEAERQAWLLIFGEEKP